MNWMIIVALTIPYFYLLLLVNLNQSDVKKMRKELFECRNLIRKMNDKQELRLKGKTNEKSSEFNTAESVPWL
jgi:hypothetical protein